MAKAAAAIKVVVKEPAVKIIRPTLVENGKSYIVKADYQVSAKGNTIPAGHTLREQSDGWYKVFCPNGDKHFLTVGPELLKKLEIEPK